MSPGELSRRDRNKEIGRQPGRSRLQPGFAGRAGNGHLSALLRTALCIALGWAAAFATSLPAAEPTVPRFDVSAYVVKYNPSVFSNAPSPLLSQFTGTNIGTDQIVQAASAVQIEFQKLGYPTTTVSVPQEQITNGIVTMYVFQGAAPQILVSGRRYAPAAPETGTVAVPPGAKTVVSNTAPTAAATNTPGPGATNTATAGARSSPGYVLSGFEVTGNTLLPDEVLQNILSKHTGTNTSVDALGTNLFEARAELQLEYFGRGYVTAKVVVPEGQSMDATNGIIKIRILEGTLTEIKVVGNRFYSSNNVMRALPSLETNMILNSKVFGAELDRANANQDRQIYPELTNGPTQGTTTLLLGIKDRLPLHAKIELNNQSSPGTPDLRVNSSAVYNNLWQLDHSLGVQYSFSPELYKQDNQWAYYDRPLVANYSGFYRLPLGNPEAIADVVAANPGSFGYDEGTRKFNLPPPSGTPELNVYASRATIDTGVTTLSDRIITNNPGVLSVEEMDVQQDLTINENLGARLSIPLKSTTDFYSGFSGGADFKIYDQTSNKTNNFLFTTIGRDANGNPTAPVTSIDPSSVPVTHSLLRYLPLSLRYDASLRDSLGTTAFGLGFSVNTWYSGSPGSLRAIAGSSQSSGHWVTLTPSLSRDFNLHGGWLLSVHAEGQWASEPLISNEQFGAGGVANVRGYQEGEVFGDTGWRGNLELKTPGHVVGIINDRDRLTIRGSIFTDFAETFLLDPQGRPARTPLWGAGFGGVATIGSRWDARLLFSLPLLPTGVTEKFQPRFNFSLTAQF